MNREQFADFLRNFKWLFSEGMVSIYDSSEVMEDILDTLPAIRYDIHKMWSNEFECYTYFIKLTDGQDTTQFEELAQNLEYLLRNNIVIVKSYDEYNNICNFIGRLGIKHSGEVETNFANERIWVIGIDREWS